MSYIGRGLQSGAFRQLDDISSGFDGSDTTHTMQVNSTNVTVGDVNQILLSLGGVIQKPGTDFTVSSSTLTFTTAPAANTSFFAILLGSDNGGTTTPTDGSVTTAKIVDANVTKAKLADAIDIFNNASLLAGDLGTGIHIKTADSGAGVNVGADNLVVEDSGDSGITILAGTSNHSRINFGDSGDNDIGMLTYDHGANQMNFKTNAAFAMTIDADGEVIKTLNPCFRAGSGSQNNIAVSSNVNAVFDNEIFDVGANFGSSTFTAPVTGKYFFTVSFRMGSVDSAAAYIQTVLVGSNRNTTLHTLSEIQYHISADTEYSHTGTVILDMDANDTANARIRIQSGTAQTDIDTDGSYFSGFLIG